MLLFRSAGLKARLHQHRNNRFFAVRAAALKGDWHNLGAFSWIFFSILLWKPCKYILRRVITLRARHTETHTRARTDKLMRSIIIGCRCAQTQRQGGVSKNTHAHAAQSFTQTRINILWKRPQVMQQLDPHPGLSLCVCVCVHAYEQVCVQERSDDSCDHMWPTGSAVPSMSETVACRRPASVKHMRVCRWSVPSSHHHHFLLPARQDFLCDPFTLVYVEFPHSCTPFSIENAFAPSVTSWLVGPVENVNVPRAERGWRYAYIARQKTWKHPPIIFLQRTISKRAQQLMIKDKRGADTWSHLRFVSQGPL